MTNNDAIVTIVDKITKTNKAPCKKTLQKIVFLVEEKGLDLGCDYVIHFYGPYSSDLDFAIRSLKDDGILDITVTHTEHIISVLNNDGYKSFDDDVIDNVIDEFGKDTPSDLELIATALYVYRGVKNESKIMDGVKKIKGQKYKDAAICKAISRLKKCDYIN